MVRCGYAKFVNGVTCGVTIASSECLTLKQCSRNIKPHLRGLKVLDKNLKDEIQLLLGRAGKEWIFCFDIVKYITEKF